jgi:hypothetical protein
MLDSKIESRLIATEETGPPRDRGRNEAFYHGLVEPVKRGTTINLAPAL